MPSIKHWGDKIKEKRKQTPWRDFLRDIVSFLPMNFYKDGAIISRYPPQKRIKKLIDPKKLEKQIVDFPFIEYQSDKNFFENLSKLYDNTPFSHMISFEQNENAKFADVVSSSKDVYLSSNVLKGCENVAYSFSIKNNSKSIFNSSCIWNNSENIYQSMGVIDSYNVFFSQYINNCRDIYFCNNLHGCKNCIFCKNLENVEYYWDNRKLEKREYEKKLKNFLGSHKKDFFKYYFKNLDDYRKDQGYEKRGNFIYSSENIENGNIVFQVKNGRNLIAIGGKDICENMYDCIACGSVLTSDVYAGIDSGWGDNIYYCNCVGPCSHLYYCQYLENCSFCLGCIGLKNKSYCILNKEYSKEEWYKLVDKIFTQMEKDGILGEFFPGSLNPFYFNDTMAYLIDDSFSKEEVEKEGFMWRDEKIKVDILEGVDVIKTKDLVKFQGFGADGNWQINPEILKKVIVDKEGNYYKIVKTEYDFLVKHELPLPEIHWLERIKMGFRI